MAVAEEPVYAVGETYYGVASDGGDCYSPDTPHWKADARLASVATGTVAKADSTQPTEAVVWTAY